MAKRLQEYIKYTAEELDLYTKTEGSCIRKVNTNLHLSMRPFCLADFKRALMNHIVRTKVGFYDVHLDGIVLDIKKIKVLGRTGALRGDDPRIHININGDVYVFKPEEGAELTGLVKHIGPHQVGVILYRVFNANLRVAHKVDKSQVQMDQKVKFRIRKYDLQNVYPYIDGELLIPGAEKYLCNAKKIDFKQEDNVDSGIEERESVQELDDLLSLIKSEVPSGHENIAEQTKKKSEKLKRAKSNFEESDVDSPPDSISKKSSKKRKNSSLEESHETLNDLSPTNITHELNSTDKYLPSTPKKIKKEKDNSSTKRHKSKASVLDHKVQIKKEVVYLE